MSFLTVLYKKNKEDKKSQVGIWVDTLRGERTTFVIVVTLKGEILTLPSSFAKVVSSKIVKEFSKRESGDNTGLSGDLK